MDRRTVLKGTAALAAAAPLAVGTAQGMTARRLIVFDSRLPESASFAAGVAGQRFDLARAHETQWAELRGDLPEVGGVEGLIGWSDWTAVRGELESRGFRRTSEARIAAPLSGKANLFRWSMMKR
ncbi:hypothetical protein [Novosphingobium sp. CF614]|uniref:hypothetical protein n=1 Tax=Novosphingobium sp. CF614 TaxID=1884364 RepID=UPI000B805567|nr:hypothetical protein [Novosphingobium sp. CF614]